MILWTHREYYRTVTRTFQGGTNQENFIATLVLKLTLCPVEAESQKNQKQADSHLAAVTMTL